MVIIKILIALIAFSFIVSVHELFHFIAAKLLKAPLNDFSVGMGKAFLSYQNGKFFFWDKHKGQPKDKSQLSYNLRILPLGGFVAFESFEGRFQCIDRNFPPWIPICFHLRGCFMIMIGKY